MIRIILKRIRFITPIIIVFIGCDIFLYFTNANISKINDNDFLFGFTGILLGFALTIFPFITTLIDSVRKKAEEKYIRDDSKRDKVENLVKSLCKEVKDDIAFVFISLLIIAALYIIQSSITPFISLGKLDIFFNKTIVLTSLRLSLFLLNLLAIYDLIAVSFKLSDSAGILKKIDEEHT
jgi:hypothetical protein